MTFKLFFLIKSFKINLKNWLIKAKNICQLRVTHATHQLAVILYFFNIETLKINDCLKKIYLNEIFMFITFNKYIHYYVKHKMSDYICNIYIYIYV